VFRAETVRHKIVLSLPHVVSTETHGPPFLDGKDLPALCPLKSARLVSKEIFPAGISKQEQIRFSEHLTGGAKGARAACELGLEGLIGQGGGLVYVSGRGAQLDQAEVPQRQEFCDRRLYAPGGAREGLARCSLLLPTPPASCATAGKVGTGYDDALLKSLSGKLSLIRSANLPSRIPAREGVQWVQPSSLAGAFAERTDEGILRRVVHGAAPRAWAGPIARPSRGGILEGRFASSYQRQLSGKRLQHASS